jgi:hypothetical protein
MKSYKLHTTFGSWFMTWGMSGIAILFVLAVTVLSLQGTEEGGAWPFGTAFLVIFLILIGATAVKKLRAPSSITLHEDGTVEFSALLSRVTIRAQDIESIKPSGSELGYLIVQHSHGKVWLLNQFNQFHEFVLEIKRLNPSIELRGC